MDLRQRGVAHVNIFWSLVPFVLMLAAAGYGYMKHVEADENAQRATAAIGVKEALENTIAEREAQLKDLTSVLGNAGKFRDPLVEIANYTPPSEFTTADRLKTAFDTWKTRMSIPGSFAKLGDILQAGGATLKARTQQIAKLTTELTNVRQELAAGRTALKTVQDEFTAKVNTLETRVSTERSKLDEQVTQGTKELEGARKKTRTAQENLSSAKKQQAEATAKFEQKINTLSAVLTAQGNKLRLINSPDEPDGTILSASAKTGLAWIDIGAKDMVKAGLTFRILQPVRGGYKLKGKGRVARVEAHRSLVMVTGLKNELNPVVRGDVVANDLYSPNLRRNVLLLGRFGKPFSKGEVTRMLENAGNKVYTSWSPAVDLVIVGREAIGEEATKIADMPEYQKAERNNTEIVALHAIKDFLRL